MATVDTLVRRVQVAHLPPIDSGHGVARLPVQLMKELGLTEGDVIEIADLFVTRGGRLQRAEGFPPHAEAFERAGYDVAALLAQRMS